MKSEVKRKLVRWTARERQMVLDRVIQAYQDSPRSGVHQHRRIIDIVQRSVFIPTFPDRMRPLRSIMNDKEFKRKAILNMIDTRLATSKPTIKFNGREPLESKDKFLKILDKPILPEERMIDLPVNKSLLDINALEHAIYQGVQDGVALAVEKVTTICIDRVQVAQGIVKSFEARLDKSILEILAKAQNKVDKSFEAYEQFLMEQIEVLHSPKISPVEIIEHLVEEPKAEVPIPVVVAKEKGPKRKIGIWGPFAMQQQKILKEFEDTSLCITFYSGDSSHNRTEEPGRYFEEVFYMTKQANHTNTHKVQNYYPKMIRVAGGINELIRVIKETMKV